MYGINNVIHDQILTILISSRYISRTDDEVLQMEMSSLLESVTVSGQHVLLAAQKLSIQPHETEHREELIGATQNVLLGVVKVKYCGGYKYHTNNNIQNQISQLVRVHRNVGTVQNLTD